MTAVSEEPRAKGRQRCHASQAGPGRMRTTSGGRSPDFAGRGPVSSLRREASPLTVAGTAPDSHRLPIFTASRRHLRCRGASASRQARSREQAGRLFPPTEQGVALSGTETFFSPFRQVDSGSVPPQFCLDGLPQMKVRLYVELVSKVGARGPATYPRFAASLSLSLIVGIICVACVARLPKQDPSRVSLLKIATDPEAYKGRSVRICGTSFRRALDGSRKWELIQSNAVGYHPAIVRVLPCDSHDPLPDSDSCLTGRIARQDGSLTEFKPDYIVVSSSPDSQPWYLHAQCRVRP